MSSRRVLGMLLAVLLLAPAGTGAQQEATPMLEWWRLYNSLASPAGLAVNDLADDPGPLTLVEAELRLTDLADALDGIVPDPCYEQLHHYARLTVASVLAGVRLSDDGIGSGLGGDDDYELHRIGLGDLAQAANYQLAFPNARFLAWVGESCAG